MKRLLALLSVCCGVISTEAQDVIVKKDGSTILAKVQTVGDDVVEYKKHSNLNGPTYKINVDKLLSINYENGEKDTFESITSNSTNGGSNTVTFGKSSPDALEKNRQQIAAYNSVTPKWATKQKDNEAKHILNVVRLTKNSVLENDDLKLYITLGEVNYDKQKAKKLEFLDYSKGKMAKFQYSVNMYQNYALGVKVQNKTDHTIYIDLGNTFITRSGEAQAYYVPSSTVTSKGKTAGGSVNLGSVASAVGIGGAVGTLAGGVNVGGSNSATVSKVEYAQRVLAIPPMSTKILDLKLLFDDSPNAYKHVALKDKSTNYLHGYTAVGQLDGLKVGDIIHWSPEDTMMNWGFYLSYAVDEACSQQAAIHFDMYVSDSYGIAQKMKAFTTDYVLDDLQESKELPLRIFIPNKGKNGINCSKLNIERN